MGKVTSAALVELDRVTREEKERSKTYQELGAADEAHEIIALGDSDSLFNGEGMAAAARYCYGSQRGILLFSTEVVAEEYRICLWSAKGLLEPT
jgi:hypothetical protein